MINVSEIKRGIVIDHIVAGHGIKIFQELHFDEILDPVVLLSKIPSRKMGVKDMLKIETDLEIDTDVLGLIDPNVTINVVQDGKVTEKINLNLPQTVQGIMTCKNPRCITQYETVPMITFHLIDKEKKTYRCEYCDSYTSFIE